MKKQLLTLAFASLYLTFALAQKPELGVPVGHAGRIFSVAFSPDGKFGVSSSEDKTIKLWKLNDGKLLKSWEPYRKEVGPAPVFGVGFSTDGKYIVEGTGVIGSSLQSLEIGKIDDNNVHVFMDPSIGLAGLQPSIRAICVSKSGAEFITLDAKNELKLWSFETGKLIAVFESQREQMTSLCITPDGKWAYTGNADGSVQRWDVSKRKPDILYKSVHNGEVKSIAVSSNNQMILSGADQGDLQLWKMDGSSVQPIFTFKDSHSPGNGQTAVFSPNDSLLAYAASDKSVVLWDISKKTATDRLAGHEEEVSAICFSPDGTALMSGSFDNSLILWDVEKGERKLALNGYSRIIKEVFFTPNKKFAVAVPEFSDKIVVWDTEGGGVTKAFFGHRYDVVSACVSPKGKYLLSSGDDQQLILWDFETAKKITTLQGYDGYTNCVAFSPDEKYALAGTMDNSVILWNLDTRKIEKIFNDHQAKVTSVAFSPDGLQAMSGADDQSVNVYNVAQKSLAAKIPGQKERWSPVAFAPDGKSFLSISCEDFSVEWWDIGTKELKKRFDLITPASKPEDVIYCGTTSRAAFSPSGEHFLLSSGNDVLLWNLNLEKPIYLRGHKALVKTVAFSPDGRLAISAGYDGSVKMWDGRTGKALCTVFHINEKDWVAITPSGLFDASPAAMKSMYFVLGLETIELEQLKERYYEPDLLPILLGFKKGSLREVDALTKLALYPEVSAIIRGDKMDIDLKKRSGGFGKVSVAINGAEVLSDACNGSDGCKINLQDFKEHFYSADSMLAKNTITVRAYNQEGWLKSPELVLYPFGKKSRGEDADDEMDLDFGFGPPPDPSLYAIVVGTSDYAGTSMDLGFPDKDARAMAVNLEAIAKGTELFKDRVHIHLLTTDTTNANAIPSKQRIRSVFQNVARNANAEDVLIIFLSGHGVTSSTDGKESFYYLTKDVGDMKLEAADIRNSYCIASDTLSAWISAIPAKKRVVIFDACHSGKAAESLTASRAPQSSQKREMERIKDRNGMFVLASSESNQKSWEDQQLQQGLLTYSLLFGMDSQNGIRSDGAVDVQRLFQFARDYVPQLASGINEDQTPVLTVPDREASSFSIGFVTKDTKIQIGKKNQFISQSMFLNKIGFDDNLALSVAVDNRLEAGELEGALGKLIFANTRQMNDAFAIRGFYEVKNDNIKLEGRVFVPGANEPKVFLIENFPTQNMDALVEKIMQEVNSKL